MASVPEKLRLVRIKLEWAKKRIGDLDAALMAFYETKPHRVTPNDDLQSGQHVLKVSRIDPVPFEVLLIAGDMLHNLRSALDHLIWQLVLANGQTPTKATAFPICDSAARYNADRAGKVKGVSPDAVKVLDSIEPYQGGKGHQLWVLHQLDITDKHRLLFTTETIQGPVDFAPVLGTEFTERLGPGGFQLPQAPVPVKVGDVLFTRPLDMEVAGYPNFSFGISLREPQVTESEPIRVTLNRLGYFADGVVDAFAGFL